MISEKIKLTYQFFKEHIVGFLIVISIILVIFSFVAPYLFTLNAKYSAISFNDTGAIGDTIGGLMNPFIALAGVSVTFLAFYMQYKANKIQVDNFTTEQKKQTELLQEQLFFRLVENLNQRVVNFSYSQVINGKDETSNSYDALHSLTKYFRVVIDEKCSGFGRHLLAEYPERVLHSQYMKLLVATSLSQIDAFGEADKLQKKLVEMKDYNERWEYLKVFIGSTDDKNPEVIKVLKSIAHVLFYKLDFYKKESLYIDTYDIIYKKYGGFLDGYMKNLQYLLKFIKQNGSYNFFSDYITNNLSTPELVIIFYYCASRKSSAEFKRLVKEYDLLNEVHIVRDLFIDIPSEEELSAEIDAILNYQEQEAIEFYSRKSKV